MNVVLHPPPIRPYAYNYIAMSITKSPKSAGLRSPTELGGWMRRTLQCWQAILSCRTAPLPCISPSPQSFCLKTGVIRVHKQYPYDLPPPHMCRITLHCALPTPLSVIGAQSELFHFFSSFNHLPLKSHCAPNTCMRGQGWRWSPPLASYIELSRGPARPPACPSHQS